MNNKSRRAENISHAFWVAFGRCMEQRPLSQNEFEMPAVPGIVCAAFSVEIGFKALIMKQGKEVRGHKLDELFSELLSDNKEYIIRNMGLDPLVFKRELKTIANVFSVWRYIYEKSEASVNVKFLKDLAWTTQDLISLPAV